MNSLIIDGTEYRIFNQRFAVSRGGGVLLISTQTPAYQHTRKDGYRQAHKFLVHRMVATCWLDRPEGANDVHHINENKGDNSASNLMWVTRKEHLGEHHDFSGRYERTEETKAKLRDYRTGRKTSEETKKKQREANLRLGIAPPARPKGFRVSEEQCAAQSEKHWRNTSCEIDGIRYRSFSDAGRALGIFKMTVRKRCLSPNFSNYVLVND